MTGPRSRYLPARLSWLPGLRSYLLSRCRACSTVTNPGVKRGVGNIGQEICQERQERKHQDRAKDEGVVALASRFDRQPAQPWPGKNRLDDERAADDPG